MAFCAYCGKELPAAAGFCPACGKPVRSPAAPSVVGQSATGQTGAASNLASEGDRIVAVIIDTI